MEEVVCRRLTRALIPIRCVRWCFGEGCDMDMVNRDVNAAINILKVYRHQINIYRNTGNLDLSRPGALARP